MAFDVQSPQPLVWRYSAAEARWKIVAGQSDIADAWSWHDWTELRQGRPKKKCTNRMEREELTGDGREGQRGVRGTAEKDRGEQRRDREDTGGQQRDGV
jgi:hypothetical protein